ncbi:unnamed protein product [Lota lota]
MVALVQSQEAAMKRLSGSERLGSSVMVQELLLIKDSSIPVSQVLSGCGLTRGSGLPRGVLSCIQTLASPSSSSPAFKGSSFPLKQDLSLNQTRFNTFLQAASCLQQHEGLRCCLRCSSPALHNAAAQRATCTRGSCQFDCCTLCHQAFHGALPCRTRTITQGRTRSKHALRRL